MRKIPLNRAALEELRKAGPPALSVPPYDREELQPGIVHIGLGHFHRAHQAAYLDELIRGGRCRKGIFEVNLVAGSLPLAEIARAQDCLYTLITRSAGGEEEVRIIGALMSYLDGSEDPAAVIERLAREETSLITLTVTEKGYHYGPGGLDWTAPDLIHDRDHPEEGPRSLMGFLAAALSRRMKAGGKALTIMSCDNVPHNGSRLREALRSFCGERERALVPWLEDQVSFPNSMVDRITPGTTAGTIQYLEDRFGLIDRWPVRAEDFRQWVLEDNFRGAVPGYGAVGVQIVKDVEPYELMKIRLLNGSHSALAYPAWLLGRREVAEAILDPPLGAFIRRHYMEEITATLRPVEGIDLEGYKDTLINRFSNKNIADSILRLASDGSKKIPHGILQPLTEAVRRRLPRRAMIFALAAWARFLSGVDEQGGRIPLEDPRAAELSPLAERARGNPAAFLRAAGLDLGGAETAAAAETFAAELDRIYRAGMRRALEQFMAVSP